MARSSLMPIRSGGLLGDDPFLSLHREMNRLFDDVLRGASVVPTGGQGGAATLLTPQINISETENEIRVTAELPGATEKDIHVDLNDDVLVIRGEKKLERKEQKENFHFVERSFGTFQRAVQLPFPVDPEKVQANFENGVLTITLPKTAQQERSRRIQVQAGAGQSGGQQTTQGSNGQDGSSSGQSAQGGGSHGGGNQGGQAAQDGASAAVSGGTST